jgi:DNA-binding Lrp family transcriptional regulator
MTLFNKLNEDIAKRILESLSAGKNLKSFTQLKQASGLSPPTLSKYLKRLQEEKLISRDIETRKYKIEIKGYDWLRKSSAVNTIKDGAIIEKTSTSFPVNSIVAIDIQNITKAQQRMFMRGTPTAAEACFKQFLSDCQKIDGKLPENGRIVYTTVINFKEVNDWSTSKLGKDYLKKN